MRYLKAGAVVFLSMIVSLAYAQTDSVQVKIPLMINTENSKSLEFHLWGVTAISYKQQLSERSALRYSVDISSGLHNEDSDRETVNKYSSSSSNSSGYSSSKYNTLNINFSPQYLIYPATISFAQVFVGGGPLLNYNKSYSSYEAAVAGTGSSPEQGSFSEKNTYSFGLGLGGVGGIECFLNNKLSLIAEYRLSITYSWLKSDVLYKDRPNPYETTSTYNGHSWDISLNSVRIGIAYYF